MPELLLIGAAYLVAGLGVALLAEEAVGTRRASLLGLCWPATLIAFAAAGHAPTTKPRHEPAPDDDQGKCLHEGVCVISKEGRNEFSVRIIVDEEYDTSIEIGRLHFDQLTKKWAAISADGDRAVLGFYDCGRKAVEALIIDDYRTSRELPGDPQ